MRGRGSSFALCSLLVVLTWERRGAAASLPECTFKACPRCLAHEDEGGIAVRLRNLSIDFGNDFVVKIPFRIGTSEGWSSQAIFAQILGILSAELLGIQTEYVHCADSYSCSLALSSCAGWQNYSCNEVSTKEEAEAAYLAGLKVFPDFGADVMFVPEVWDALEDELYNSSSADSAAEQRFLLLHLISGFAGASGYTTQEVLFLDRDLIYEAWNNASLDLTTYWMLNNTQARDFVDTPADVLSRGLGSMSVSNCTPDDSLATMNIVALKSLGWVCNNSWWLSPGCQALGIWQEECLVVFGQWMMWNSEFWPIINEVNLPMAYAFVESESDFNIGRHNAIFQWWTPDSRFREKDVMSISFGWDYEATHTVPKKLLWRPAARADGKLSAMLEQARITNPKMRDLMRKVSLARQDGHPVTRGLYQKVACDWLREHWNLVEKLWLSGSQRCVEGEAYDEAEARCDKCPQGTYYDVIRGHAGTGTEDRQICQTCLPGRFSDKFGGIMCECCHAGKYNLLEGQSTCAPCPVGANCERNGTSECSTMFATKPDYGLMGGDGRVLEEWENKTSASLVQKAQEDRAFAGIGPFRCPVPGACKGNNTCVKGMTGPLCGSCMPGFTRTGPKEQCGVCPNFNENFIASLFGFFVIILVVFFQDRMNKISTGGRDVNSVVPKILSNLLIQLAVASDQLELQDTFEESMEHPWMLSLLGPLMWSSSAGKVVEDPTQVNYSLDCLLERLDPLGLHAAYRKVIFGWLLLPTGLLMVFMLCWLISACRRVRTRKDRTYSSEVEKSQPKEEDSQRMKGKDAGGKVEDRGKEEVLKHAWNIFLPKAIVLMYILHPTVTNHFLGVFVCQGEELKTQTIWDDYRLLTDMEVVCWSTHEHRFWSGVSAFGILFWSFGIPFGLWWRMRCILNSGKATVASLHVRRVYGFLFVGFEPDYYYYESVFMARKVMILVFAVQTFTSARSRKVMLTLMQLIFFAAHLHYEPFDNRAYKGLDRLQTYTMGVLIALYSTGLLVEETDNPNVKVLAYIPVVAWLCYTIAFAAYLMMRNAIWPLHGPSRLPKPLAAWLGGRIYLSIAPISDEDLKTDQPLMGNGNRSSGGDPDDGVNRNNSSLKNGDDKLGNAAALLTKVRRSGSMLNIFGSNSSSAQDGVKNNQEKPPEHVLVGHCEKESHVAALLDDIYNPHDKERMLLKDVFGQILDTLLERQRLFGLREPTLLSLPSLILQLERMCVACTLHALKKRVKDEKERLKKLKSPKLGEKARCFGWLRELKRSISFRLETIMKGRMGDEGEESITVRMAGMDTSLVRRPVSVEELHMAIYELCPQMLNTDAEKSRHFVTRTVNKNKHLVDMVSNVSWLFEPTAHQELINARSLTWEERQRADSDPNWHEFGDSDNDSEGEVRQEKEGQEPAQANRWTKQTQAEVQCESEGALDSPPLSPTTVDVKVGDVKVDSSAASSSDDAQVNRWTRNAAGTHRTLPHPVPQPRLDNQPPPLPRQAESARQAASDRLWRQADLGAPADLSPAGAKAALSEQKGPRRPPADSHGTAVHPVPVALGAPLSL